MKHLFIYTTLLLGSSIVFLSCDSTTSPKDIFEESPVIQSFNVSPQNVQFTSADDGVKDTTVIVTFSAETENLPEGVVPRIIITDRNSGQVELQQDMEVTSTNGEFTLEVPFETKTTFFQDFKVNAIVQNPETSDFNYATASLKITGFSEIKPEILEANNPETVQRPTSGTDVYRFTAKVTDEEGNDTIQGVFVRIFNRSSGEVNSSPFTLFDDGDNGADITAGDSVYTAAFPVNPESQLQTFDLYYYAIDKGGLVSDTVQTTFRITE
ncbi:MAG: hypothetical protein JJ953_10115 [Gracilimonas sp.]|uniref:hypothetical protein n=1 Tax=Gracilimonas TaxID=649462 RepID=UPI001B0536BE|nr:hypothetical protein [Gracilimonas sp.]MBO6586448.1 hypothetical protein [Gracilimonas sp.]MBO6615105.1 hypothetical protein [Gracilimonas sp.]